MQTKQDVFNNLESFIHQQGFEYTIKDDTRPWGGFFVIADQCADKFAKYYFDVESKHGQKISPKFLVVQPGARLSWQYHHRRAELWKLIEGESGLIRSMTDDETALQKMIKGEIVSLEQVERHRLVGGVNEWGIVAEIWLHTNPENPSDEEDIVRLQDDFGRNR